MQRLRQIVLAIKQRRQSSTDALGVSAEGRVALALRSATPVGEMRLRLAENYLLAGVTEQLGTILERETVAVILVGDGEQVGVFFESMASRFEARGLKVTDVIQV